MKPSNRTNRILVKPWIFSLAAVASLMVAAAPAVLAQAQPPEGPVTEMGAMILKADGQRQRGFVQNSNENGLLFSLVQGAPGTGFRWKDDVVAVAFDDGDEIMREARAAFYQGNLESAAEQLGSIADRHVIAAWAPQSFAAEARYLQIEALRRLGRWEEITPLLESPAALAIPKVLSEFYQPQHRLNLVWAQLGSGQMDPVAAEVESRQVPQIGDAKLLPSPAFQPMPMRELVQITFMRARLNEAKGEKDLAIADYYRTFSYTYANDKVMAQLAMEAAMAIQAQNPEIRGEEVANSNELRQMQSLAYLYKLAFSGGQIDPAYADFAVMPDLPKPPPVEESGAAEGQPEPPAPAPADEKAKGKGKAADDAAPADDMKKAKEDK